MKDELYSLELFISKFLRWGVAVAGLLMLAGWLSQISFTGNPFAVYQNYQPQPFLEVFSQSWRDHQWGIFLSYLGLCALISLPLLRVLMTAILFFKRKEYLMAVIASTVMIALLVSFSLGFEI